MALYVQSLASGSSGNALLIRADRTTLLIDAGISASSILAHLQALGLDAGDLTGILLTHEHSDHVLATGTLSRQLQVPVIAPSATLDAAEALVGPLKRCPLPVGHSMDWGDVSVRAFPVPHDAAEPVGFVVQHRQATICYATDIGAPVPDLLPHLDDADLLILEANHDLDRLLRGRYPAALKARVRGDRGHLSNAQAAQLLVGLGDHRPRTVWLAHLSAANNTPMLARQTVATALASHGIKRVSLDVLRRDRASVLWDVAAAGWQLPLFSTGSSTG